MISHSSDNQVEFDPFAGPEIEFYVPSTESQLEIWLSCKLGGEDANRAFNESLSIRFKGDLNTDHFGKALYDLCIRHESLRSAFSEDGTQMVVFREPHLMFSFEDISGESKDNIESKIQGHVKSDALFVFDLISGPLCKFSLFRLAGDEYYFILTAHHIICDGWSMGVILQDLSKIYSARFRNEKPDLEPADSFVKYAILQAEFVKTDTYKNNVIYWVNKFKTLPELNLPLDNERVTPRTYNASRYDYLLDNDTVNAIKKIGVREGCSFVNTLLAAFEIFISGISGQDEIVVGLPAADQSASGNFNLVGHCVNLLPIKSVLDTELTFTEYLRERKSAILDAYDHQQFTFGSLLKSLKIKRDLSRVPLVPVVFNIDMDMDSGVDFHGLQYKIISNPKEFRNFELSLNLWGSERAMQLEWSYNSDIFKKETIVNMMAEFESLLKAIYKDPAQKIENLIQRKASLRSHRSGGAHIYNENHRQYWFNIFKREVPLAEIYGDKPYGKDHVYEGRSLSFHLDPSVYKKLEDHMASNQLSGKDTLLTLVAVLFMRYAGQPDLVIGTLLNRPDRKDRTFPLRFQIDPSLQFDKLVRHTGQVCRDALLHDSYSIGELTDDMNLRSDRPWINVLFSYNDQDGSVKDDFYKGWKPGIKIDCTATDEGLDIQFEYDGNIFNSETIARFFRHLEGLAVAVTTKPGVGVGELEYIDRFEKEKILNEFCGNYKPGNDEQTIIGLFEKQVQETPDRTALVFEDKQYTYKELNEKANRLGDFLRKKNKVSPDDLVGVKLDRNEWLVIAILGILKSGAAYLPVDPKFPTDRISYILNDSNCKFLIDQTFIQNYLIESGNFSRTDLLHVNTPIDLVYVIYTSGSTGTPKGVMIENASLVNYISAVKKEYGFNSDDRLIHISNIVFDASAEQLFLALLSGATLYLYGDITANGAMDIGEFIESNGITHLHAVPTLLRQINFNAVTTLKRVVSAGEVCPLDLAEALRDKLDFYNKYGPTEATISVTVYRQPRHLLPETLIPIGYPIENVIVYILDANLAPVPVGVPGQICIGGGGLARGYLNNTELTNEKFIKDPFRVKQRIYLTGDIGRWRPDGSVEYLGRNDFQVKVRGYRIELGEIESIFHQFPFIRHSAVLVKEENNGNQLLVAFVESNQVVDFKELRVHLNEKLPAYMVPSYFIQIDEMPLTASGKINRNSLKERLQNTRIELNPVDLPSTPEEKLVAKIWSDLLGIEHINKSDNFFELGGHSLIAIKVIIRLENETGFKLPMSSLFEYPTIEKIAKLITSAEKLNKWKALVPIKPGGKKIPLYLIHGGGLGVLVFNNIANHFDEEQPVYGLQALGMDGKEDPLSSVEEMASFYISEIMEQNSEGPYAIAGHSSGSIIAFEMAKQLTRLNKKVNYLAVFDYDYIEIERQKSLKKKIRRKTIDFIPELIFITRSLFKRPKKTIKHQILIWHLRYITMLKRLGFEKKVELEGLYLHINKAKSKFEESLRKYKMEPYDGEIDLFISEDKVYYQDDPQYLGWRPFTKKRININRVKGDHDQMILPPNDKAFAKILQKRLDTCNFELKH